MVRVVLIAALFGLALPILAESPGADDVIATTLCAIKARPERFSHKLVEFTAIASHGFEDSFVESAACAWSENNNPEVWLEFGGTATTDTVSCCRPVAGSRRAKPLRIDGSDLPLLEDQRFLQLNARLHPEHPPQRASDLVRATLRGRIFARKEALSGRYIWAGYGRMGILFVLTQVIAVDPKPVTGWKFDLAPPPPPPLIPSGTR